MKINPLVVDLSHYDPANNYAAVRRAGVVGVIYKCTQGTSYQDGTYLGQRNAALKVGLKWGAYHFADASDPLAQAANFLNTSKLDGDSLFCLDLEENGDSTISEGQAESLVNALEAGLGRPNECVIYSGNLIKEWLGNEQSSFWGARRLWLAQYGSTPEVQPSWEKFWLWQYTDGTEGPEPHTIDGCDPMGIDISSYQGSAEQLAAEWASASPAPPAPEQVIVTIIAPPGVKVEVKNATLG